MCLYRRNSNKKPNRYLSYARRGVPGQFLSTHDRNKVRSLHKQYKNLLILLSFGSLSEEDIDTVLIYSLLLNKQRENLLRASNDIPLSQPILRRTIDSFETRQYWAFFNTTKDDLNQLYRELLFTESFIFDNESRMSGEEVFLRGLYELRTGCNQFLIAENVFGGCQSLQSFTFKSFINHIYDAFMLESCYTCS
jgi:hypothetical protein